MALKDFYRGTTKKFDITITYDGVNPDISNDIVSIVFKTKKGGETILTKTSDVLTFGITGKAVFHLDDEDTDIIHGRYYYEIIWELVSGDIYVAHSGTVNILERL